MILDWDSIAIKTDHGTTLVKLTMQQVELDLQGYLMFQLTGVEVAMAIDWNGVLKDLEETLDSAKKNPKKILGKVEADLINWMRLQEQAEAQRKRFPRALHKIFAEAETNKLERNTAISYVLQTLQVKIKDAEFTRTEILEWIRSDDSGSFVMAGKPTNYLYRLKDEHEAPTGVTLPAGAAPPEESAKWNFSFRLTDALKTIGVATREELLELAKWVQKETGSGALVKPSDEQAKRWVAIGKPRVEIDPDREEDGEDTGEDDDLTDEYKAKRVVELDEEEPQDPKKAAQEAYDKAKAAGEDPKKAAQLAMRIAEERNAELAKKKQQLAWNDVANASAAQPVLPGRAPKRSATRR